LALAIVKRGAMTSLLINTTRHLRQLARRSTKQPLPALFAITTLAAAIGGFLYEPNNYDFLAYRFSRMLHWWDAGHWHWIHTSNARMNYSGTGMEWAMMPLLVFSHSSRLFFLINIASYLLMPGLMFSILTQLGVKRRTAWFWMWILPTGYCYVSSAGGVGNDTFGTVLALTALHFGCRAIRPGNISALWLALLAAGLMTSVKACNLPLLLPVLLAIRPAMAQVKTRWPQTAAILCLALIVSYAPTAILNHQYTGNCFGDPVNQEKLKADFPKAALLGNSLQLMVGSLAPPLLPHASTLNTFIKERIPDSFHVRMANEFPKFCIKFRELGNEESAGLGIGITTLLVTTMSIAAFKRRRRPSRPLQWSTLAGGAIALLVYTAMMSGECTARLLSPYYPILIAALLALPGTECVTRLRWWRSLAVLVSLSALLIVALTPSRPLWPAQTITRSLASKNPGSRLLARVATVYTVYHARAEILAPAGNLLPSEIHVIGFIQSGGDPEVSLWKPLGRRRVMDIIGPDMLNRPKLDQMGIQAIVARRSIVEKQCGSLESWLAVIDGHLIATVDLTLTVAEGEQEWCIVKLQPPAPTTRENP
jgi:hypothetical protein